MPILIKEAHEETDGNKVDMLAERVKAFSERTIGFNVRIQVAQYARVRGSARNGSGSPT